MKNTLVKALFVAAVPFAMNAAFADDITPEPAATPSTLTRAEVLADLAKARAAGELVNGEQTVVAKVPATTVRSREEVRAEAIAAYKTRKNAYQAWNQS
ncbi:MAG: DUF4148 domain-containing protein [Burkholderiaceae bacterium]